MEYVYRIDIGDVEKNLAIQYKATILDHLDAIHDLIEKWEIQWPPTSAPSAPRR